MSTAPPASAGTSLREPGPSVPHRPPAFAWLPLTVLGLGVLTVGTLVASRYGYFGDELYFLAAGHHLSLGYVDQPFGVPLLARTMQALFPDSLEALRLPSLLSTIGYLVLTALTTRELGGTRTAQTCTALACVLAPHFVGSAHLLVTYSFDQTMWAWVLWLLVRWVRRHPTGDSGDLLLLAAGAVTALALQFKLLIPALWVVLVPVSVVLGPRRLLRRPGLWAGGALAVFAALPSVLWQWRHGWPQLDMADVVEAETGGVEAFLKVLLTQVGPIGSVLTLLGLGGLLFARGLREYRFLGVTAVLLTVVFAASGGRSYYLAGFYAVLFAAGAVLVQQWWWRRPRTRRYRWLFRGWTAGVAAAYLWALPTAVHTLPLAPVSSIGPANVVATASLGWQPITEQLAAAYHNLPGSENTKAVVTHDYWSAGALHHFGPEHGLSEVYSPSRGFWYFGHPSERVRRVVYLGSDRQRLGELFESVRQVGTVNTDLPASTYYEGMRIWVAEDPKLPWSRLWPRLYHMSLW
ncbi:ArnT family glycosyltransferase [Actinopolyspora mortivallis]|uniref:ArnT family glycosyltransferase n=1 Tax=Actinopolyspora mortivallis TaxID=33906 RepID=UPI0003660FC7|nr:glycosyltransferase family 39 protein [Actinopolyspora mortivallis]